MPRFDREETRRIARLARLTLADDEADALGRDLDAITRDFSDLAAFASTLPPPPGAAPAPSREDVVEAAPPPVVEAIRKAFPRRDSATGAVRAPRGSP